MAKRDIKRLYNKNKYKIKEEINWKLDKELREAMDAPPGYLTDKELDEVIDQVIKTSSDDDKVEPFSTRIIPKGNNKLKTKRLFYNKKYYDKHAFPRAEKSQNDLDGLVVDDNSQYQGQSRKVFKPFHIIDFNHRKAFYGKIDVHNRSIYPSEKFLSLVDGTKDVMLLNFVCEALNGMIRKIEKLKESGVLKSSSSYYNFGVRTGWTSLTKQHHKTMNSIYDGFVSKVLNKRSYTHNIVTFDDYSKSFIGFLGRFLTKFPISRTNLQLRSTINPRISGICFEISTTKHDDDEKKYVDYILDDHFLMIQNIANGFGFMLDKNAPWRFIADLESPQMRERMRQKGFDTLQDMFDNYYYRSHLYEVNSLKQYFLSFYDSYIESYPYVTKPYKCKEGAKAKVLYRKPRVENPFTDKKLLEFYYFIRAKEAQKEWNQEEFNFAFEEAHQVFKYYGFVEALNHINDKTTLIIGDGGNHGIRTKKDENNRIINNHQPLYKRNNFTIYL